MIDYHQHEIHMFHNQLKGMQYIPLAERQENEKELVWVLHHNIERFYQSVSWLINGDFGFGSFIVVHEVIGRDRMNYRAWIFNTACALDYRITERQCQKVYNSLDDSLKKSINDTIDELIELFNEEHKDE